MTQPDRQQKCPHCGHEEYIVSMRVTGSWQFIRSPRFDGSITDKIILGPEPKTVTCHRCLKRFPNPDYRVPT